MVGGCAGMESVATALYQSAVDYRLRSVASLDQMLVALKGNAAHALVTNAGRENRRVAMVCRAVRRWFVFKVKFVH